MDRGALNAGGKPFADLFAIWLNRRHTGVRQVRRAPEDTRDRSVVRQRLHRIQPTTRFSLAAHGRQLLAPHQTAARDVAVRIALPHADKDLAVFKQFEPPVGHGRSVQKERSVPTRKVRTAFSP
ncbi:TPA: hypothetical protein I8455_004512 [Aeromonas hydrophila]|nr:hypothetical protein FPQ37_29220 [Burkholderia contaminans]QGW68735.1 hypothetical protein GON15_06670 [Burkholderia contaminans]QGW70463.1 hypothetical protein GON15_15525 [Burkholderia contaminans]HAT2528583.1 hypothetical protein [Aeromonas hydrophila]HAT3373489.1 hypothetical protein [Aeromonas hydrophila]